MHRLRVACVQESSPLTGVVEIDETCIGGLEKNKHNKKRTKGRQGRSTKTRIAVAGMRSRDDGTVMAGVFKHVNSETLQTWISQNVDPDGILSTDEAKVYKSIKGLGIIP